MATTTMPMVTTMVKDEVAPSSFMKRRPHRGLQKRLRRASSAACCASVSRNKPLLPDLIFERACPFLSLYYPDLFGLLSLL
jgi:hypothetical protein